MNHDTDKIDEAVLALLYLGLHDVDPLSGRCWKSFDWDSMNRLYEKGLISDPKSKAKSVLLDSAGLAAAEKAFEKLFGKTE